MDLEADSPDKNRAQKEFINAENALDKLDKPDERDSGLKTLTTFIERIKAGATAADKLFEDVPNVGKKLGELAAKIMLLLK